MTKSLLFLCCVLTLESFAATIPLGSPQEENERTSQAVVRNKQFYKVGRIEVTGIAGVMPFDSLVNHYMFGGRATWHISDHFGWEILDGQFALPSVSSYTTSLVQARGLSNLQTLKLHTILTSNFVVSPVYGKIRFFGRQVLYFDAYLLAGFGFVNDDTLQVGATAVGATPVTTILRTGWDPVGDFGLGFKIFFNHSLGFVIDLRDYITYAPTYGAANLKSNFSVYLGLSFFFPGLG